MRNSIFWSIIGLSFAILVLIISDLFEGIISIIFWPLVRLDIVSILNGFRTLGDFGGILHFVTFPISFGIYFYLLSLLTDKVFKEKSNNFKKSVIIFGLILIILIIFRILNL